LTEDEEVRNLIRQMYETAENTFWPLSAEDIRSQGRRGVRMPITKVLVSVTAAAVIILVVVLVGTNTGSGGHANHPNALPPSPTTTTTNSPIRPITRPADLLGCLNPRAAAAEPRGGWLPNRGGVLDYNPDSTDSTQIERPSAEAMLMATRFGAMSGRHFIVVDAKAAGTSHCAVVQWAQLRDKTLDSAYLALLRLRRPIDPDSFPLLGATTNRLKLRNGTEVLSSQTSNGGVVTVVATRTDGLTLLLQIRRAGDEEGVGYPTTILPGPGASNSAGPALISEAHAIRIVSTVLSKTDIKQ
jgi:hypothetical protein